MSYIDTQGMSLPSTDDTHQPVDYKPPTFKKLNGFTDMEREELKELFRQVLDEYT